MKATEIVNQIKDVLGIELTQEKVELATMKLDNGTEITAESFEPKNEVFIVGEEDSKIPLPVGDYILEDSKILVVKSEGIIDSIGEPEDKEAVEDEEKSEEVDANKVDAEEEKEEMAYATKEELAEVKSMIEEIKAMIEKEDLSKAEIKEVVEKTEETELSAVEPIAHNPEALSSQKLKDYNKPKSHIDLIRQLINNK